MATGFAEFLERMSKDQSFAEAVKMAGDRIAEAEKDLEDEEILRRAGKEMGYEFTAGDIERNFVDDQELDGAELRNIAGGGKSNRGSQCLGWCVIKA